MGSSDHPVRPTGNHALRLSALDADMDAWADAHPCDCEALCECALVPQDGSAPE